MHLSNTEVATSEDCQELSAEMCSSVILSLSAVIYIYTNAGQKPQQEPYKGICTA